MQKKISIFSFFSGIGILDLAFEKNGYNIVFVNEYDNLFIESYRYARMQMNLRAPIYGYRNDSAERYARRRGKKNLLALIAQEREKGNLVGFIGGPPCPDFSVAGKNAGVDGENGRLTKIYFDIICRCHPDFFLFENVKGLVKTEKHRAFYKEMMMKVQANDYVIAENVLNALAYGVPQFRERVFMVGIHKKIYQNEPNTLIFKWDKHALFNTENVLTRTWPKEREFATDSSYVFPAKGILKKLTVEYWFHKNDVENHPNGNDIFQVKKGRNKIATIAKEHSPRLLSFKDFDKTSDTVSFDLKRVCRLTHDYVFYLYKLYLEYRGRQPFQTINLIRQEDTSLPIMYNKEKTGQYLSFRSIPIPDKSNRKNWCWVIDAAELNRVLMLLKLPTLRDGNDDIVLKNECVILQLQQDKQIQIVKAKEKVHFKSN